MSNTTDNGARVRYTIDISNAAREALNEHAKNNKLTQGEVIEVALDLMKTMLDTTVQEAFERARDHKLAERSRARELAAKLRTYTPEQIEAALIMVATS